MTRNKDKINWSGTSPGNKILEGLEGLEELEGQISEWGRDTENLNTNAVSWISNYTRNPIPTAVVCDPKTGADRSGKANDGKPFWKTDKRGRLFYWLELDQAPDVHASQIEVILHRDSNGIQINQCGSFLRILLRGDEFDFTKPINVILPDNTVDTIDAHLLKPSLKQMVETLIDRGDPKFIFDAAITIQNGSVHPG